jgi:hypothetical protein
MPEPAGEFGVGCLAPGAVPRGPAFLVQGVDGPGHHVEWVHRADGVRGPLGDDVRDPLRAVGADVGEPVAPLFTERVEEGAQYCGTLSPDSADLPKPTGGSR